MALFRYGTLSKDEKIYIIECESVLLPGKAISAQLCKFSQDVLWDIDRAIRQSPKPGVRTTFKVGDMVFSELQEVNYRAEVLRVFETECLLDFVDLGVTQNVRQSEIFPLTQELCTRWERIAIHILLKDDMQVFVEAAAVLSCMDVIEIDRVRYYHGKVSDFSEYNEKSKLFRLERYIPEVPAPTESVPESTPSSQMVNGHGDSPSDSTKIPQPVLNDRERVFVSVAHPDDTLYGVQLAQFDVLALEEKLDTFYGDPKNRKPVTNIGTGSFVIAPFGSQFCRAIVLSVDHGNATVLYTDYGSQTIVPVNDLTALDSGSFADHPWAAITIETEDKLIEEEEILLKIESTYNDAYGLPIYRAKKILTDVVAEADSGPVSTSEQQKPSFPPVEFNEVEQILYVSQLEGNILAAQLGQYTAESLISLNEELTNSIEKESLAKSTNDFAAGDLVAVKEEDVKVVAFYRGLVSKVEGEVVWIYQVDFGILIKSEMKNLWPLPAKFINHPQVGIRCELSEAQVPKQPPEEALHVKNLRKKTHIDEIDIYEFDLALTVVNGEHRVVAEPKSMDNDVTEPKASGSKSAESAVADQRVESEQLAKKSLDLNHNITGCDGLELKPLESTAIKSDEPRPDVKESLESTSIETSGTQAEPHHRGESVVAPSESQVPSAPAEANICQLETGTRRSEGLEAQLEVLTLEKRVSQPDESETHEQVPKEQPRQEMQMNYDFATAVEYPDFASVPERVYVSQKTDSSLMVTLCRFNLDRLHAIDNEIKAFLDKHPNIEPSPLNVGDFVIFIRDDYCRRAEIVEKVRDEFQVACIDYGCSFVAPKSQLVRLPKVFEKYVRCAVAIEGTFPFRQGQEVDLILTMDNGKVLAKTAPSVSPPNVWNEHNYSESTRSCSVSVISDNADDDDLKSFRDPEDPCADKSFDVMVTAVHRATKVCVVKSRLLSLAKAVGETLGNQAQNLQPVILESLKMGSVVVAKLMTEPPRFRRAKVTHYNRGTELFRLFLVDSGLMVKMPLSSLFKLPADFSLERTPAYATILALKADDLTYDAKIVSEVFGGTLRCNLSYSHPDDFVPGELCYEATLHNRTGNVVKQLNMKGIVSSRTDRFLPNPVTLPCTAEADYLDAIIVGTESDASSFSVTLLLVELKERLDRVIVDTDQLKNLYARKNGAPALAFLENDPSPWKRARVIGRPFPGKYKLLLVDVGTEITHPVLKTYRCPNNLLHIPEAAVEVSIQPRKQLAPTDLQDRLVVVKTHWDIDYTSKTPAIELYDHEGDLLASSACPGAVP